MYIYVVIPRHYCKPTFGWGFVLKDCKFHCLSIIVDKPQIFYRKCVPITDALGGMYYYCISLSLNYIIICHLWLPQFTPWRFVTVLYIILQGVRCNPSIRDYFCGLLNGVGVCTYNCFYSRSSIGFSTEPWKKNSNNSDVWVAKH